MLPDIEPLVDRSRKETGRVDAVRPRRPAESPRPPLPDANITKCLTRGLPSPSIYKCALNRLNLAKSYRKPGPDFPLSSLLALPSTSLQYDMTRPGFRKEHDQHTSSSPLTQSRPFLLCLSVSVRGVPLDPACKPPLVFSMFDPIPSLTDSPKSI